MPGAKHKSDFEITTDTTYLALTGDLWGVCCEEFVKTRLSYNGTTLYTVKLWYCNMKRVLRGFDSHVVKTCQKLISEPWPGHTNGHSLVLSARLLHSPRLVAVGLSAGYGTCIWLLWLADLYRLGTSSHPMHYGLTWTVGISTVFQRPLTVPLHSPNGRQMPAVSAVQGDCGRVCQSTGRLQPSGISQCWCCIDCCHGNQAWLCCLHCCTCCCLA